MLAIRSRVHYLHEARSVVGIFEMSNLLQAVRSCANLLQGVDMLVFASSFLHVNMSGIFVGWYCCRSRAARLVEQWQ